MQQIQCGFNYFLSEYNMKVLHGPAVAWVSVAHILLWLWWEGDTQIRSMPVLKTSSVDGKQGNWQLVPHVVILHRREHRGRLSARGPTIKCNLCHQPLHILELLIFTHYFRNLYPRRLPDSAFQRGCAFKLPFLEESVFFKTLFWWIKHAPVEGHMSKV